MAQVNTFLAPMLSVLDKWRTSLTFRVLTTTTLLALLVAFGVSSIALTQVRDGLVADRTSSAINQAVDGVLVAQRVIDSLPFPDSTSSRIAMVDAVVAAISAPGGKTQDYEVLLLSAGDRSMIGGPERGTNAISDTTITAELRETLEAEQELVWQITEIQFLDGHRAAGIVIGAPLQLPGVGDYHLFQAFPFDRQVDMLNLTRQAVFVAAIFMVIALIGVALLLTSQVVRPIRSAAESAQRLRAGRLTERIAVKGQDDLAVLASSFNSMAASMQEQIRKLESLSRVQQRFVSDVSHELRTPLTTIRMAAELLYASKADFDPANERAIELLQQQSERFEYLLNDLLEISRIDAGSAKLDPVLGEFEMIVRNVLEDLSPIIRDNGVIVEEIQIPASPAMLTADFRRLERIVRNLISNAIEHANGNPITLVTYHDEKVVVFSVRDQGSGLEPGQAALVFNRFWRADPSRQRTLGGTGLGLSISMEDARLHGGWLEADGAPNEGAHFRLVLPLQPNTGFDRVVVPLGIKKFDQWLKAQS